MTTDADGAPTYEWLVVVKDRTGQGMTSYHRIMTLHNARQTLYGQLAMRYAVELYNLTDVTVIV